MSLNCKPGDLAIVVLGNPSNNIGKVIRVTTLYGTFCGYTMWNYDGRLSDLGLRITAVADNCLRPILPPPGTVSDSEVRELYSPQTEQVTA